MQTSLFIFKVYLSTDWFPLLKFKSIKNKCGLKFKVQVFIFFTWVEQHYLLLVMMLISVLHSCSEVSVCNFVLLKSFARYILTLVFLNISLFSHVIENYISTCHLLGARSFYFVLNWPTVEFRTCDFFVNNWCLKKNFKWPPLIIQLKTFSYVSINPFSCENLFLFCLFVFDWYYKGKVTALMHWSSNHWLVYSASSHIVLKVLFIRGCISSCISLPVHGKMCWQFYDFCLIFVWQLWGL